jgi:F-type H+-transporting ATPase subunit epsilon
VKTFHLEIAAPDGMRYNGEAEQLSVRGITGELAILAGHIPFVTALAAGECRVYGEGGRIRRASCGGGFLTVTQEAVRLLSTDFTWKD